MDDRDLLKANDEIARRFAGITADLALPRSAAGLFETLLTGIESAFAVPFTWLTVIRSPETASLLEELEGSPALGDRLNILSPAAFAAVVPDTALPILACGDLRPFFRLLPPARKFFIRSLAIAPLTLHGRQAGSLNLGDASPTRYEPGMDTTLLGHLARSVSNRLGELQPRFFA
jgi:uncharacterized protein YigA (DUF484 family)